MEKEPKNQLPKSARYPLFLLGMIVILVGELAAQSMNAGLQTETLIGGLGFVLIALSVLLR